MIFIILADLLGTYFSLNGTTNNQLHRVSRTVPLITNLVYAHQFILYRSFIKNEYTYHTNAKYAIIILSHTLYSK